MTSNIYAELFQNILILIYLINILKMGIFI